MMRNQKGFTIVEMLMVILLVAILAAVAIPQFLDFRTEARNASVNSALGAIRTSIANQKAQMMLRCTLAPVPANAWPEAVTVTNNNIAQAGNTYCNAADIPAGQNAFVAGGFPANQWGAAATATTVSACVGGGCAHDGTNCAGTGPLGAADGGWCYNQTTGAIWANSAQNGGGAGAVEWNF